MLKTMPAALTDKAARRRALVVGKALQIVLRDQESDSVRNRAFTLYDRVTARGERVRAYDLTRWLETY